MLLEPEIMKEERSNRNQNERKIISDSSLNSNVIDNMFPPIEFEKEIPSLFSVLKRSNNGDISNKNTKVKLDNAEVSKNNIMDKVINKNKSKTETNLLDKLELFNLNKEFIPKFIEISHKFKNKKYNQLNNDQNLNELQVQNESGKKSLRENISKLNNVLNREIADLARYNERNQHE